jgi:S1-C subfamily serine protease
MVGLGLVLSAHPHDAKHVFQKVAPSVVALIMEDDNRQPLALGSGFVVGHELILTNFHVIRGAAAGRVKLVGDERLFLIEGVVGGRRKARPVVV